MTIQIGKRHSELIWCPKCKDPQVGSVIEADPFPIYVHTCHKCGYVITESEWNPVLTERDLLSDLDIANELIKRGLWVDKDYVPDETMSESVGWSMAGIPDSAIMDEAIKRGLFVFSDI